MTINIDTLINARWVIPIEPEDVVHEHFSLAINEGKIIDILPSTDASLAYSAHEEIDLPDHALIPGLINCHTHAAMSLFRGLADDLPLMDWLNKHIWPAEQRWVNPEFVEDGTCHAIAEMIRSGTTCFNDMYFFPDKVAETASECGIRACVSLIMIDFPTAWAREPDEYFLKGEQVHDKFKYNPLVRTAFAPHAPYTVSDAPLRKIATLAEELDIQIHMHIHETAFEVEQGIKHHGKRPLLRLHELGLVSNRMIAVHMTQLEKDEIELIAKYGVSVVHCPESNLKLASGFCPVNELQSAGINVALGTDGAASNNDLDMLGEMRTAAFLGKGVAENCTALPAHYVLKMATLNSATALGIADITGSLTAGKEADIVAIDLNAIETQPLYHPVSQIVYACNRNQVTDVWVAGKQLLKNRELTTIDETAVLAKAQHWQKQIISKN